MSYGQNQVFLRHSIQAFGFCGPTRPLKGLGLPPIISDPTYLVRVSSSEHLATDHHWVLGLSAPLSHLNSPRPNWVLGFFWDQSF